MKFISRLLFNEPKRYKELKAAVDALDVKAAKRIIEEERFFEKSAKTHGLERATSHAHLLLCHLTNEASHVVSAHHPQSRFEDVTAIIQLIVNDPHVNMAELG